MEEKSKGLTLHRDGAGLTLIELLIVIVVIGVLLGSLVSLIDPGVQLKKTRDATRKSDLSRIRSALQLYRSDIGNYPAKALPFADPINGAVLCNVVFQGGSPPNTYMTRVPCDPLSPGTYFYELIVPSTVEYKLWACLENINDKDRDGDDQVATEDKCSAFGRVSYTLENP